MYQAAVYSSPESPEPEPDQDTVTTPQPPPWRTTIYPYLNIGTVSSGLNSMSSVTVFDDGDKFPGVSLGSLYLASLTKVETLEMFVHNVPPHLPHFDLEFNMFRTSGTAAQMKVVLHTIQDVDGTAKPVTFNGTVDVPASGSMITTRLVQWSDGDSVAVDGSSTHRMPRFSTPPGTTVLADVQPVMLELSSTTSITDGGIHLASFRYTFYQ